MDCRMELGVGNTIMALCVLQALSLLAGPLKKIRAYYSYQLMRVLLEFK